jgi:hypothetical protein
MVAMMEVSWEVSCVGPVDDGLTRITRVVGVVPFGDIRFGVAGNDFVNIAV